MTDDEKTARIATEIMGWEYDSGADWFKSEKNGIMRWHMPIPDWNPRTRWDHAGMVLEKLVERGACLALIYDDNGHWALAMDGMQNVPLGDGPGDIATTFFVEAKDWHDTPQIAIFEAALATLEVGP